MGQAHLMRRGNTLGSGLGQAYRAYVEAAEALEACRRDLDERRIARWSPASLPPEEIWCVTRSGRRIVAGPGDARPEAKLWRGDLVRRDEALASFAKTRDQVGARALLDARLALLADLDANITGAPDQNELLELELTEAEACARRDNALQRAMAAPAVTLDDLSLKVELWRSAREDPTAAPHDLSALATLSRDMKQAGLQSLLSDAERRELDRLLLAS